MNEVCFFDDLSSSPAPSSSTSWTSDAISRFASGIEKERMKVADTEEISLTISDKGGADGRVERQAEMSAAEEPRRDMAARRKYS